MRFVSITVIISYLLLLYAPALTFQQQQIDMEVTLVRQDALIGNKGSNHGISVGIIYNIRQGGTIIGTAIVKIVKQTMCGLKLREIKRGYTPRVGDKLILSNKLSSEQQSILSEMQETNFTPEKLTKVPESKYDRPSDYYYDGQAAAESDYGSAFGGGFFAGLFFGVIGWGIGYAIVSGQGADVPPHYITNLDPEERLQFSNGYKEKIKSKRKKTFNTGALTGTLIVVTVLVLASSSQ